MSFFPSDSASAPKALVCSAGIMSPQEVQCAAVGEIIHLVFDAARQPLGGLDCGGCFEGFGVDFCC